MAASDLAFTGLAEQARLVREGDASPRELVEHALERIARLDPELNAFRTVFADRARAEAEQAAGRLAEGDERPLLGVPVAIKDEVDVAGEVTTYGTGAYGPPARADSEVVRRLRAAGAIPIGMTNVPELTMWAFSENKTWGITRNPWDPERTPGGSSGGSAAAVAAGMVPAALATDGLGSVRIPAACCGLFGIKPQRGRVSWAPLGAHWYGLSVIGSLARSVEDAALLLDVIAEVPGERPFMECARPPEAPLRIALSTRPPIPGPVSRAVKDAVTETGRLLESLGHRVEQRDPPIRNAYLSATPRYLRGIRDDVDQLLARPHRLERRTRHMAALGSRVPEWLIRRADVEADGGGPELQAFFRDVDVLLTPTIPKAPLRVGAHEGRGLAATANGNAPYSHFNSTWNLTGQPAVAVPAGFDSHGLPLSVQLVGRPHDEATLLSVAAQLESERPWAGRRPALAA